MFAPVAHELHGGQACQMLGKCASDVEALVASRVIPKRLPLSLHVQAVFEAFHFSAHLCRSPLRELPKSCVGTAAMSSSKCLVDPRLWFYRQLLGELLRSSQGIDLKVFTPFAFSPLVLSLYFPGIARALPPKRFRSTWPFGPSMSFSSVGAAEKRRKNWNEINQMKSCDIQGFYFSLPMTRSFKAAGP